ncbi:hypothetical protein PR202_ga29658 [Eleusine coracana subsp. coracana]|uniref:Uncharacterized protein n=1 Tax=Eleusine coracana subsp. coracana TaxID=191504 RepID=A0AAV5DLU8_ELECO|nr:hypothetical protein PR202_ga29658 [Eleusine coracana subsp. coracana]
MAAGHPSPLLLPSPPLLFLPSPASSASAATAGQRRAWVVVTVPPPPLPAAAVSLAARVAAAAAVAPAAAAVVASTAVTAGPAAAQAATPTTDAMGPTTCRRHEFPDDFRCTTRDPRVLYRATRGPKVVACATRSTVTSFCTVRASGLRCPLRSVLPDDMIVLAEPAPEDMVQAIKKAINMLPNIDPKAMHLRMKKLYSWDDVAERTEAVYDHAMQSSTTDLLDRLPR